MSSGDHFQIRMMKREEVAFAMGLAACEGWNPGASDAECFYAADPNGFLIGELNGEAVGCASAVSYEGRFGFLGLYIVRPEFRGRGFGMRLWRAAMDRLAGHNIGLDGVVAQQPNYMKSGFRLTRRNVRYRLGKQAAGSHPEGTRQAGGERDVEIVSASEVEFDAVRNYDALIFPARRDAFLRAWLSQPSGYALAATRDGRLAGYTVIRKCHDGWKIGPLAADDGVVARRLFDAACARVAGNKRQAAGSEVEPVYLDVPEMNAAAIAMVRELAMTPVFETARMYTGPDPEIDADKVFGVTTFELG
jgi:GNAT superfamily N-acetyltransferase